MNMQQIWIAARKNRIGYGFLLSLILLSGLGFSDCQPQPPVPSAPNPDTLCFPPSRGVPDFPNPPAIDGLIGGVPGDLGWSFSTRYVFNNGTSVPDAIVQTLRNDAANMLYLSFEVNNDKSFDDKDAILLVFGPGGGAGNDRRIIIFPNNTGITKPANSAPRLIRYWTNSATWNNVGAASVDGPAWLVENTKVSGQSDGPTSQHWYIEMKIPISAAASVNQDTDAGINFPAAGNFGFYFNVIRTENNMGNLTAQQFPWPNDALLTGLTSKPQENTPLAADWGSGVRNNGSACNGVFFDWYDIKVDHAGAPSLTDSQIALNAASNVQNKFTVSLHNDTVDSGGNYVAANGVQATFKIRNFGLGNQYELVGASDGNPVAPNPTNAITIPASNPPTLGTATAATNNWKLNGAQQTKYANSGDQCVLVELSATGANTNTVFKNKSTFRNMDFVATNSPFRGEARLVTNGYKTEQGADSLEFFLNAYQYYTNSKERWATKIEGVEDLGNGQYRVKARPGTEVKLTATITPPPVTLPNAKAIVAPGTGGAGRDPIAIPVKPGQLITLLAEGSVQARDKDATTESDNEAGPNGIFLPREQDNGNFLLPRQFQPAHHVGALIGSWDKFKEKTFLLGSENTLKVPKGVETLFLAMNDTPEGFRQHKGNGFRVELIATPLEEVYTYGNSLVARDPAAENLSFPVAVNLPTWALCGQRVTGKTITIEGQAYKEVEGAGCYAYAVKSIGQGNPATGGVK